MEARGSMGHPIMFGSSNHAPMHVVALCNIAVSEVVLSTGGKVRLALLITHLFALGCEGQYCVHFWGIFENQLKGWVSASGITVLLC